MNSPFNFNFKVSQIQHEKHDGLDLVPLEDDIVHSTVNGTVIFAGWENPSNHSQGFGQYVKIKKDDTDDYYYFGHLAKINVKTGDNVKITDNIGVCGSTGFSSGKHLHYCCRAFGVKGNERNISEISGIPNKLGIYNDGYKPKEEINNDETVEKTVELIVDGKTVFKGVV